MNFLTNSHLVLTTKDVATITDFWRQLLALEPHFENKGFAEFVLPPAFALPFFFPRELRPSISRMNPHETIAVLVSP